MRLILGREPALILGTVSALVQLGTALGLPLTAEQQGAINALTAAMLGLVLAASLSAERAVPAILGLTQAAIAAGLAWGLNLPPDVQSTAMATVAALCALWTRGQVVAPVAGPPALHPAAVLDRVGRHHLNRQETDRG